MLQFSTYLEKNKIKREKLSSIDAKNFHVAAWANQLSPSLKTSEKYYPKVYAVLAQAFAKGIDKIFLSTWLFNSIDKEIKKIDRAAEYLYCQLINYMILESYKNPISSILSYPYNSSHSGVSMSVYLVDKQESEPIIISDIWEACDSLQAKNSEINYKSAILRALKKSELSAVSKELISKRVTRGDFHAEDNWFSTKLPELMSFLKQRNIVTEALVHDDIWVQQLNQFPRIEVVISSSCCEDCRKLFSNLRQILNNEKLHLPIVIFANSPFNTFEVSYSPIAIIKFDGTYFDTQLVAKMPYTKQRQKVFCQSVTSQGVFCREKRMFSQLESSINHVVLLMIESSPRLRNEFIDNLFTLFTYNGLMGANSFCWFVNFLERLPLGFYTEMHWSEGEDVYVPGWQVDEWLAADRDRMIFFGKCVQVVHATQTKVEVFLGLYSKNIASFFEDYDYLPWSHSSIENQSEVLAQLDDVIAPYAEFNGDSKATFFALEAKQRMKYQKARDSRNDSESIVEEDVAPAASSL